MIPSSDYVPELLPASAQDALRNADATKEPMYMVPIDKLVVDPQFNIRVHNKSHEVQEQTIIASIMEHGFYKHMPLPAYPGKFAGEDVLFVAGGFTRFGAAKKVRDSGVPLTHLPVVLRERGTNIGDLLVGLAMDNTGKPLSPYERALLCKRLKNLNWSERKIAKALGIVQSYVHQLLGLLELPQDLQQLVIDERVAATLVINTVQQVGVTQALAMIQANLALHDDDAPLGGTNGATPRRTSIVNRGTRLTSRVCLAAIDYAIQQRDLTVLEQWRSGDHEIVAAVNSTLSRKRREDAQPAGATA